MKKLLLSMLCLGAMTAYAGNGTEASPYTCAEVIAMGADLNVASASVQGYIVGYVTGTKFESGCNFTATGAQASNVIIADAQNETDYSKCVPIQLVAGTDIRAAVNLSDNPGNLGKTLTITGQLVKYFGVPGVKAPTAYKLDGEGTNPQPDVPEGPVTFLDEKFDNGTIPANWKKVKVSGDKDWYGTSYNDNGYAAATGYKGTTPPFDEWLISPAIDMAKVTDKVLTFDTQVNGYGSTTTVFEVYLLNSDDPATATKTKLQATIAEAPASGYSSWVSSGDININATGEVYFGFRYYATADANYATWCVDNVKFNAGSAPAPTVTEYNSIAEFLAAKPAGPAKFLCPLHVAYQNGVYMYVTDGTDPLLVYGATDKTYKNGDIIPAGVVGSYKDYSGQIELVDLDKETFAEPQAGAAVEPEVYQVEELSAELLSTYIKVLGVTVSGTEGAYKLSDGTAEIDLYNRFKVNISAGEYSEFVGFVSVYNGTVQLYPINDLGTAEPTPDPVDDPNVAYFHAPLFDGVTGAALYNKDGSTKQTDNKDAAQSLCGLPYTEKGVTLEFSAPEDAQFFSASYDKEVRWYQGGIVTITPMAGVTINKVFVKTVANSKGAFTASEGEVEGTGEGASNPITWTGTATNALVLTSAKAIRFSYIEVTTTGADGVDNVTVNDDNAPVEYFNLQGVRVANPQNGLYIRRQGNTATKVLVK